ncbi:hypothetical protein OCL90_14890, partial [Enterococcus faecalis]|nr:hypothetical protein [Enterococcus faecalis]
AKEVADNGRTQINGVLANPSGTVMIGDLVKIQFGDRILEVEVLQLNVSTKKVDVTYISVGLVHIFFILH